jgi:hypothetical protein
MPVSNAHTMCERIFFGLFGQLPGQMRCRVGGIFFDFARKKRRFHGISRTKQQPLRPVYSIFRVSKIKKAHASSVSR